MTARQIAELIDRHAPALVLYARQWCATPEDVVQEAFCRLVQQPVPPDDPPAWLFRVVRNRAMDIGKADRRRRHREEKAARVEWFEEPDVEGLDVEAAMCALQSLPLDQREIIIVRLWGGLNFEQIAATSGCSVSSAHRRYEAGIARLRESLGVECKKM